MGPKFDVFTWPRSGPVMTFSHGPHLDESMTYESGHETVAVLLPGFAIN